MSVSFCSDFLILQIEDVSDVLNPLFSSLRLSLAEGAGNEILLLILD